MQRIERIVYIGFGLMGALAAAVLGMGQNEAGISVMPAAVATVVCLGAVWVTDLNPWLRLGRGVSHAACLLAIVLSVVDVARIAAESRVLALANLLLYLQCVQSLRLKDDSSRWSLTALALVEVAVAAALNDGMLFLPLLFAYFVVSVITIALFVLTRDGLARAASTPARQSLLAPLDEIEARSAGGGLAPRDAWDSVRAGPLSRYFGKMGAMTVGIMLALFMIVPRIGAGGSWVSSTTQRTVGFTDRVRLGEMDSVSEDNTEVMRVQFLRRDTRQPFQLKAEPLIRGSTLTRYSATQWRMPMSDRSTMDAFNNPPRAATGLVVQEIEIQPLNTETLQALYPIYSDQQNPDLLYDPVQGRLLRTSKRQRERFSFQILTALTEDDRPLSVVPEFYVPEASLRSLSEEQITAMPTLVALAKSTVAGIPEEDVVGRVRALESLLKTSGQFSYSLNPAQAKAAQLAPTEEQLTDNMEPMERFISRTRQGNCEYFASALVLMARSLGIPARLIVGFRGDEYNRLGQFYVLRQLHAHSWAEIYLTQKQTPADLPKFIRRQGGWLAVDPTPGVSEEQQANQAAAAFSLREMWDYTRFLWSNYVVGLTAQRQWTLIYEPIWERIKSAFTREFWADAWRRFTLFITGEESPPLERWFNWRAGLVGGLALAFCVAVARTVRWLARRRKRRSGEALEELEIPGPAVAFYRRMEELLGTWSLSRDARQTQLEFAAAAEEHFVAAEATAPLAPLPQQLVQLFYRVRFGGRPLDSQEAEAVEHALETIERAGALAQVQPSAGG